MPRESNASPERSQSPLFARSDRDKQAARRDEDSAGRDLAADARDRVAEELDRAAESRAPDPIAPGARVNAAANRVSSAEDRESSAADRRYAAGDRRQASDEIERTHHDALTGVYERGVGEIALGHEIERAQRLDDQLVLAFVDVDGLKAVNDGIGHAAGDELLREVAGAIQSKLRSYDPVVRVGGDEFVCALASADLDVAGTRFTEIQALLKTGSVSVGLSAMRPDDSVADLMQRGDAEMRRARARLRTRPASTEPAGG